MRGRPGRKGRLPEVALGGQTFLPRLSPACPNSTNGPESLGDSVPPGSRPSAREGGPESGERRTNMTAEARHAADSNEGGHLFHSDRGHHSNLMAASWH